jgi:hypothetical protein
MVALIASFALHLLLMAGGWFSDALQKAEQSGEGALQSVKIIYKKRPIPSSQPTVHPQNNQTTAVGVTAAPGAPKPVPAPETPVELTYRDFLPSSRMGLLKAPTSVSKGTISASFDHENDQFSLEQKMRDLNEIESFAADVAQRIYVPKALKKRLIQPKLNYV